MKTFIQIGIFLGTVLLIAGCHSNSSPLSPALRTQPLNFPAPLVCVNFTTKNSVPTDQDFAMMRAAKIDSLRIGYFWSAIETSPGIYNWSGMDYLFSKTTQYGMHVLWPLCYGNTNYHIPGSPLNTQVGITAFASFAAAAVDRYRLPTITWEIWNEPDIDQFWPGHSADEYMDLLSRTVVSMRAVNPNAKILSGGISSLWSESFNWTSRCLQLGLLQKVDGLGVHLYSTFGLNFKNNQVERISGELGRYRELLASHSGSAGFPLYATEFGTREMDFSGTSEERQARQAQANVRMHLLAWLNGLKSHTWYEWRPSYGDTNFSVLNSDGSPKPSYRALSNLNARLSGYTLDSRDPLTSTNDYVLYFRKNGGTDIIVAWTIDPAHSMTIPVSRFNGPLDVFDANGVRGSITIQNRKIAVPVTDSPVFILNQ